ncbi:MAG: acyltransferase family protein [Rhizomicrobium sp.]
MDASRAPALHYRPDVDGLRALAVLLVVGYHAVPFRFPGGFIGVDVFFVISGFLISKIIIEGVDDGTFRAREFYLRRARRILPALLIVLAAVFVAGAILFLPDEFARLKRDVLAAVFFVPNITSWLDAGYFDIDRDLKPLLHLWSLGVEEQFYAVWPLLLWWFRKRRWTIMLLVGLASFALNVEFVHAYSTAVFYLPATRLWEFVLGAVLANRRVDAAAPHAGTRAAIAASSGLLLILVPAFLYSDQIAFPGWYAVLPTAGAALVIAAGPASWPSRFLLSNRLATYIGRISYPLYLWHWPLLVLTRIEAFNIDTNRWLKLALVLLAVALSAATYELVEKPVRRRWLHRRVIGALSAAAACLAVAAVAMPYPYQRLARTPSNIELNWANLTNDTCKAVHPWPEVGGWWFCMQSSPRPPTILLLGNSHANHLYPGMAAVFPKETVLNIGTCEPLTDAIARLPGVDLAENPCAGKLIAKQQAMWQGIVEHDPNLRLVIISALWPIWDAQGHRRDWTDGSMMPDDFMSIAGTKGLSLERAYEVGLDRTITFIERRGVKVVLFYDTPHLAYDVRKCMARPFEPPAETCLISTAAVLGEQSSFRRLVERLKLRHPAMGVFDPVPVFCDSGVCRMIAGPDLYMRDISHLSEPGSRKVAEAFASWARRAAPRMLNP